MFYLEVNDKMLTFLFLPTVLSSADIISEITKWRKIFLFYYFSRSLSLFGAISSFRRCLASNRPNLVLLMAQHNCLRPRRRRIQEEVDSSTDGGPFSCSLKMSTEISVFIYIALYAHDTREMWDSFITFKITILSTI